MMSFATDWSKIAWMPSTDAAYAEKFKVDPAEGQEVVEVQNPYGTGLGVYTRFPVALKSCSMEAGTFQIEGSGLLLFVTAFKDRETAVTVVDNNNKEYAFTVYYADGIATGVDQVQSNQIQSTKVIENGVLYIRYEGRMYDVQGAEIK
jgi:hypothetical protein